MTAEIAIINKSAIALAADSKVTLSRGGKLKTYDTVDKLFAISKTEPVGAMIYGAAEFMRFPWETIVKQYRRLRPSKRFDTIFLWSADFCQFLTSFFTFTEDDHDNCAIQAVEAWISEIFDSCFERTASEEEMKSLIKVELKEYSEQLSATPDFLSSEEWNAVAPRLMPKLEALFKRGKYDGLAEEAALMIFAILTLTKMAPSPAATGLVIAGFGEKELLPSLHAFMIDGIIAGKLKAVETQRFDATRNNRGGIYPFAQTDMVHRFMQGIDPAYADQLAMSIQSLLLQTSLDTASALGHSAEEIEQFSEALKAATDASFEKFWDTHQRIRREQFASPIIDMAMSLPKDELANLAESLVSLTSLQRRVSRELETVGGAIDVAVISKGDGFVWIKRKHYFKADRNLRYVNSYFSEFGDERAGELSDGNDAEA